MEHVILPTGLAGHLRPMTTRDECLLAQRNAQRQGLVTDRLLDACWVETLDHGPYPDSAFDQDGKPRWDQILTGDRYYAMLRLRVASYGPEYDFRTQCTAGRCRATIDWRISLDVERQRDGDELADTDGLVVVRWTPEQQESFRTGGNRFSTTLSDGSRVSFRLMTGQLERLLFKAARADAPQAIEDALRMRIVEVEGVKPAELQRWVSTLRAKCAAELRDAMDQADVGVDTEIEIDCPTCGASQFVDLPFPAGFTPERRGRQTRR